MFILFLLLIVGALLASPVTRGIGYILAFILFGYILVLCFALLRGIAESIWLLFVNGEWGTILLILGIILFLIFCLVLYWKGKDIMDREELLCEVARNNDYNSVNKLLKTTNPNSQNEMGWTPLMFAVSNQNMDMVRLLLKYGADININNKNEQTALSIAQAKGYVKFIQELTKENA